MSTVEQFESLNVGTPVRRRTILHSIATTWRIWSERRAARRELATVDERTLRDIGISPGLVEFELSRPSWRPLLDWEVMRCTRESRPSYHDISHGRRV